MPSRSIHPIETFLIPFNLISRHSRTGFRGRSSQAVCCVCQLSQLISHSAAAHFKAWVYQTFLLQPTFKAWAGGRAIGETLRLTLPPHSGTRVNKAFCLQGFFFFVFCFKKCSFILAPSNIVVLQLGISCGLWSNLLVSEWKTPFGKLLPTWIA